MVDNVCFEDWFFSTLLQWLKKGCGKVLIGDNLSSHISLAVLEACKENHISFVTASKFNAFDTTTGRCIFPSYEGCVAENIDTVERRQRKKVTINSKG